MSPNIEKYLPANMLSANRSVTSSLRRRNRAFRIATGRRLEDEIEMRGYQRSTKTHRAKLHPTKGWRITRR